MKASLADRFLRIPILYCNLMTFDLENKCTWMRIVFVFGLLNEVFIIYGQLVYFSSSDINIHQKTSILLYLNYYFMSLAKGIAMIYHRNSILKMFKEFRQISPTEELEKAYNLQTFLRQFNIIANVFIGFFWNVMCVHCIQPLLMSFIDLIRDGKFTFKLPWMLLSGTEGTDAVSYVVFYASEVYSVYMSAIIYLVNDLCIFSTLIQLNMHFSVIRRNILSIEPDTATTAHSSKKLIKEIIAHQKSISLAEQLNTVFTPSVLFSLLSSSFILCFTGFQLLGELSLYIVVKAIFVMIYELKQVAITCFLGDKLIEISLKICDAIYEHKWYNGTPKYRRLVLMVLMRSQHSVTLHIAGISDISLQTFRQVMSISYKVFTLLRSR